MPPMTGQAMMGNIPFKEILILNSGTEIIYSFVIILCSLMIYFGTKELYELSSHKGIKYFRQAFLFFAIAYFFRSSIKLIIDYFQIHAILDLSPRAFGIASGYITLFVFMYFSSMSIFYLLYSVMYKKWDSKKIYLFHILAFVISLLMVITTTPLLYLAINLILLILALTTFYISKKQSKKKKSKNNLQIIYTLLCSFWILNTLDILIPDFFKTFQLFIYLASITIFLLMLYKVLKKVGSN